MALFGLFGKKDPAQEARRLHKAVTQKFGPPENRQKALEELRELNVPEAWETLLARFTIRVEPGITDDEEKAYACQALVDAGEPVVPVIRQFLEKHEQVSWPLRALGKIVSESDLIDTILWALDKEGPEYARDPEKKITLVRSLGDHVDDRIAPRLVPYFEDISEDVRFSAIEGATRKPVDAVRDPLVAALFKAVEEKSERMRLACAAGLARAGFVLKDQAAAIQAALPAGYIVDKDGVVKAK